jgi:hypothetical protein
MKLRADDPTAMKNFIQSVQNTVNELKASPGDGQENINSKRVTLCNFKCYYQKGSSCCFFFLFAYNSQIFGNICRWNLCLKPYVTSRTTRKGLKRILLITHG